MGTNERGKKLRANIYKTDKTIEDELFLKKIKYLPKEDNEIEKDGVKEK